MKKVFIIIVALLILFVLSFFCSYGVYRKTNNYSDEILNSEEYHEATTEADNEEAAALINNDTDTKSEEDTDASCSDEDEKKTADYNFLVGELNGYVAVYTSSGSLYEFTDIRVDLLEDSVKERIKDGIKFQKAKEMFTFLESCSS